MKKGLEKKLGTTFESKFREEIAVKVNKLNKKIEPDETRPKRRFSFWFKRDKKPKAKKIRLLFWRRFLLDTPECYRKWTTLYFGERGGGKTIHQSKAVLQVLMWFQKMYFLYPQLTHKGIVLSNQNYSKEITEKYKEYLYHWEQVADLEFCPRRDCWIKGKHALHGCLIVFDDVSIVLDPKNWDITPDWLKEYFWLGRHHGIHVLGSLVDPQVVDISFRRSVDMAYQFANVWGTRDPDEVRPELGFVFGIYRRRRVDAKTLWAQGNLPEQTIRLMINEREEMKSELEEKGREDLIVDDDSWYGSYHVFNWDGMFWPCGYRLGFGKFKYMFFKPIAACNSYDTLQAVRRREFSGLMCKEIRCIQPGHVHPWDHPDKDKKELKADPNYCDKVKRIYEVV